ncbi:MAG: hypothetical protein IPM26_02425 [Saprospiraceae bacterium]|nr:hypothetical protein [Saprospiraceae bacterium]
MEKISAFGIIFILCILVLFHFAVVLKFIPYKNIWGGRLRSDREMYLFEAISILVTVLMLIFMLQIVGTIPSFIPDTGRNVFLWGMVILFFLSTVGNLNSKNRMEKQIFAPLSALLLVLSTLLAFHYLNHE